MAVHATSEHAYGGLGPTMLVGGWTMCAIGVCLVLLRLYAATRKTDCVRWDLIWIANCLVWCVASQTAYGLSNIYGLGNHIENLAWDDVFNVLKWGYVALFLGIPATFFAKFSIMALLIQVQGPNARKRCYFLYFLGALLAITGIAQVIITATKCTPTAKLYMVLLPGKCPREALSIRFAYWQGSLNAAVDMLLSLYPITIVWKLQTSRKTKIGFCLLMAGGIVPSVALVVRAILTRNLAKSTDITYDFSKFMMAASIELWSLIILSSIPPLRLLFLSMYKKTKAVCLRNRPQLRSSPTITEDGFKTDPSTNKSNNDQELSEKSPQFHTGHTFLDVDDEELSRMERGIVVQRTVNVICSNQQTRGAPFVRERL